MERERDKLKEKVICENISGVNGVWTASYDNAKGKLAIELMVSRVWIMSNCYVANIAAPVVDIVWSLPVVAATGHVQTNMLLTADGWRYGDKPISSSLGQKKVAGSSLWSDDEINVVFMVRTVSKNH